jgi:hypothetical protein
MTCAARGIFVIAATGMWLAAAPSAAQSRFDDVRLVTGRHRQGFRNAHFDETKGALVSDAQQRRLHFEGDSGRVLDLPFDRLVDLHSESSRYPRRVFRGAGLYLVVHYVEQLGEPAFEIFRLPTSTGNALLATIERDTGRTIDRSDTTDSFLGLPIHVFDADTVVISSESGVQIKGPLRRMSPTTIDIDAGTFPAATIRRIRVTDSIGEGILYGGLIAAVPAALVSLSQCVNTCTLWYPFTPAGWGVVAGGIAIGAGIDAAVLRTAYRGVNGGRSARARWTPAITASAHAVRASWRF